MRLQRRVAARARAWDVADEIIAAAAEKTAAEG
jgi:hypothetical protein